MLVLNKEANIDFSASMYYIISAKGEFIILYIIFSNNHYYYYFSI